MKGSVNRIAQLLSISTAIGLGLLAVAIGAQYLFRTEPESRTERIADKFMPATYPGGVVRDLSLGQTELLNAAIGDALGYSDYRYREYRHGTLVFTVYLAFWSARQRHFLDVGTHAPDNCWVQNGWRMEAKLPKTILTVSSELSDKRVSNYESGGQVVLWPGETRMFRSASETIYVVYWHLLNGSPINYERYGTGKTVAFVLDNLNHFRRGTAEQYFLRITSNQPFSTAVDDALFQHVIRSLHAHLPHG